MTALEQIQVVNKRAGKLVQSSNQNIGAIERFFPGNTPAILETAVRRSTETVRTPGRTSANRYSIQTEADPKRTMAEAIGQRIKAYRERSNWTQTRLATATGMARENIARIEAGRHHPHLKTLARIATALRIALEDLLRPLSWELDKRERVIQDSGMDEWATVLRRENR